MLTEILTSLGEATVKAAEAATAAAEIAEMSEAADAAIESVLNVQEAAQGVDDALQDVMLKKPGEGLLGRIAEKLEKTGVMETARQLEAEAMQGAANDMNKAIRKSRSVEDMLERVREKAEKSGELDAAREIDTRLERLERARESVKMGEGAEEIEKLSDALEKLSDSAVLRPHLLGGYSMRASRLVGRGADALREAADARIMQALKTTDAADAAALEAEAQVLETLSDAVEAGEKSMGAMSYLEYMARHAYD